MPQDPKTFPGSTPNASAITLARLGKVSGSGDRVNDPDWVDVHFNPASLQLQLSNELKDQPNQERKQYIAKTSAKLTMDLLFDTTDGGADVTQTTRKLQAFIAPPLPENERARRQTPPPLVMFEWGTLRFKGIVESYRETIDFFSSDGVPFRASVNLTLTRQDQVFDPAGDSDPADAGGPAPERLFDLPPTSPSDAAGQGGDPGANRAIAAANGQESLRFGNGAPLTVGGGVTLKAAAAFSSGAGLSAGGGIGAGVGLGIGGGNDAGAGVGALVGASADFGASIGAAASVSASAEAGVASQASLSATEGAFASLRSSTSVPASMRIDAGTLLKGSSTAGISAGANAQFQVGGRLSAGISAGLRSDVGVGAKLSFDED